MTDTRPEKDNGATSSIPRIQQNFRDHITLAQKSAESLAADIESAARTIIEALLSDRKNTNLWKRRLGC